MDFPSPIDIAFDPVTLELVRDVTELARQVNEIRPLQPEVLEKVQEDLVGERVYNSNAIEGNTLTLRETRSILESGVYEASRKREATEAINLGKAIASVQQMVSTPDLWSDMSEFKRIHGILLASIQDDYAGRFRDQRVVLTGAKHQPPNPAKVLDLVDVLFQHLAESADVEPVCLAVWTHWAIARIHPFIDGNGRMARLWQDLILFGRRLTAATIRQEDRNEYYGALAAADDGNFNPLGQLVARSVIRNLTICLNKQREVDELKDWAVGIVGETSARLGERRKLEYFRWGRQMERLRDAFQRCAAQITDASDGTIEVLLRPFDLIDQATWETLRSGGPAGKTWFFWINFRRDDKRIDYCFFFGHHYSSPEERNLSVDVGPNACLLVSEQRGDGDAVRLNDISDSPVTLRELLVVDDQLMRKRIDHSSEESGVDVDVDPLEVAREFIQEVLFQRLV